MQIQQRDTTKHQIAQQYAATDELLTEFRQYFPHTLTAAEHAEAMPGEDMAIEQAPTATDFVEQVLGASDSSYSEVEGEEQVVTEEEYENSFQVVAKFVHQNAELFRPKIVRNVFFMKQAWDGRKIELELRKKNGQISIRDFVNPNL